MKIITRVVAPLEGNGPFHYEAIDEDTYSGDPADLVGTGDTPTAAARDLTIKIDAFVAQAEVTPPVDVHTQLRDAKALLAEATGWRRTNIGSIPPFVIGDWIPRVSTFLQEHGQ